ncbi:hypothetical protein DWG18_11410 [Lysobacter sp. TY2-98]|nr:hypothetical protein DWG18_11410 [Lysobacter sp. TY2-98]
MRDAVSKRGVHLVCQPRDPDGITECIGDDPKSFGLFPTWRIRIDAAFTDGTLLTIDQSADPRPF